MTVGSLKRFLVLLNAFAVLGLAGTAWGFYQHKREIGKPYQPLNFTPPQLDVGGGIPKIDNLDMKLGKYFDPSGVTRVEATPETAKAPPIEELLEKLGTIRGAFVVYPPYTEVQPTIIFEFKQKPAGRDSNIAVIRLGEALEQKPHPDPFRAEAGDMVPVRFEFKGCEPHETNPRWTYFLFDMNCDGKDIQKARWKGDLVAPEKPDVPPPPAKPGKIWVGTKRAGGPAPVPPEQVNPTAAPPPPPPQPIPPVNPVGPATTVPTTLFDEDEGGILAPTADGVRYLRENQDRILEDVRTSDYVDSRTGEARGVQILRVPRDSAASRFGILEDDVIQAINGVRVTNRAQGINVVKEELRKNKTQIQVNLLRGGRPLVKNYDTRDPETRRAAKGLR